MNLDDLLMLNTDKVPLSRHSMQIVLFSFAGEIKPGGLIRLQGKGIRNIVVQRKKKG